MSMTEKQEKEHKGEKQQQKSSEGKQWGKEDSPSFEYSDKNEKFIGKYECIEYLQKNREQQEHYDGFPRFSDYETLGSNISKIQKSQQENRNSSITVTPHLKQEEEDALIKQTTIIKVTEKQLRTQQKRVQEGVKSREQQSFEFRDEMSKFKDKIQNSVKEKRMSSRVAESDSRKMQNFGEISTIKRRITASPMKIRRSEIQNYEQLIGVIQNSQEKVSQEDKSEEFIFCESEVKQKKNQPQQQKNKQPIKTKKNNRVSFKTNSPLILNKQSCLNNTPQQQTTQLNQKYDQLEIQNNPNNNCILDVQQPNEKNQSEKVTIENQLSQIYESNELDLEINQESKQKKEEEVKMSRRVKNKNGEKRISMRIREEVMRELKEESKKEEEDRIGKKKQKESKIENRKKEKVAGKTTKIRVKQEQKEDTKKNKGMKQKKISRITKNQPTEDSQSLNNRYPKRTRVKPLKYWDNEKFEYKQGKIVGINNLHIDIGKILGMRDHQLYQMHANLTDLQKQTIQAQIKYPLSKQFQFTGYSTPYEYLLINSKATIYSPKTISQQTQRIIDRAEVLIDDGVRVHSVDIKGQQSRRKRKDKWIRIGPNTRFTIYSEIGSGEEEEQMERSESFNSNKSRSIILSLSFRLGKEEEEG